MQRTTRLARRRRRRGYTLVSFAMSVFAFMGLAALVIDLGIARLTQKQMQTAVDSAAMEGLRGRDRNDLADADESRRQAASDVVAWTFDDDLDVTTDSRNFGAGPVVSLSGGVGDPNINASQLLSIPNSPVYKPILELNTGDNVTNKHGDMVAGTFDALNQNPAFSPPNGDTNSAIHEYSDPMSGEHYVRRNFVPTSNSATGDAFLVRMRRLHDDLDAVDTQSGVSSKGPEVSFLFGRGSLLPAADPSAGYSPRHHGLTVRGTGIAQARRALSVGAASAAHALPGGVAFAIRSTAWQSLGDGAANILEINAAGQVQLVSGTATPIGIVTVADASSQAWSLGQDVQQVSPSPNETSYVANVLANSALIGSDRQAFVIVIGGGGTTANRIVGFGFAELAAGASANQFVLAKRNSHIAHENASPVVTVSVESTIADDIFSANTALGDHSLLAAALVR